MPGGFGERFSPLIPFMEHFWCFSPPESSELLFVSKKWEQRAPSREVLTPLACLRVPICFRDPQVGQDLTPWDHQLVIDQVTSQHQQLNGLKKGCTEDMSGCY